MDSSVFSSPSDVRRFFDRLLTSDGSTSHFLSRVSAPSTTLDLPPTHPSLYPLFCPRLAVFHREKRVAADNPLLPCLILIAFTGSRLDQYALPASRRCFTPSLLSLSRSIYLSHSAASLSATNLNYPKGCFDAQILAAYALSLTLFFPCIF